MSEVIQAQGSHVTVDGVCDYIIVRVADAAPPLSVLKLHKLLYYVQAWHLAFYGVALFAGGFQAWVHGPVNRQIYDRFKDRKSMYSRLNRRDLLDGFSVDQLPSTACRHIDSILESYAEFADVQLEELTHQELPWAHARQGYQPNERCEVLISEKLMRTYYAARLSNPL